MSEANSLAVSELIINKAISLGASLAGIADLDLLKKSPSHDIYTKIESNQGTGSRDFDEGVEPGVINWPPDAKSALVIALVHKEDDPEMDWWIEQDDDRESHGRAGSGWRRSVRSHMVSRDRRRVSSIQRGGYSPSVADQRGVNACQAWCWPVGW